MMDESFLQLGLGEKLRRLREDRSLDRSTLARRAGLDEAQLAAFEADREVPAIGDLIRLASKLDVGLGRFFQKAIAQSRVEVVRSADRWTVPPPTEAAKTQNYHYQSLSHHLTEKLMSPFLVEIPPRQSAEAPSSSHEGEEFLFVLSGQLEVSVLDEVHHLDPGDSIYFDSRLEHSLRASAATSVRLIACVAQPGRTRTENPIDRAYR